MAHPSQGAGKARDEVRRMFREDVEAAFRSASRPGGVNRDNMPALYAGDGMMRAGDWGKTPGELFVESQAYRAYIERYPGGGPSEGMIAQSDPVAIPNAVRAAIPGNMGMRALVTSGDTSGGAFVRPDFLGMLGPGQVRPLRIRELVTIIETESDAVEYIRETSRTASAATVAEATASTGTTGTKPEAGLVLEVVTAPIRVIAVHIPVTNQVLSNAPVVRMYIDDYLRSDIAIELEDQMIAGDGTGQNFTGILNTTGVQTLGAPAAGESNLDQLRKAIRMVVANADTEANAVVLNPTDSQDIDLLKVNNEVNHFVGGNPFESGPNQIWGLPRVESKAVPAGTALVGDFTRAMLLDREQTTIEIGTINDQFIRNMRTILAEARAGFAVPRPGAFVKVTLA